MNSSKKTDKNVIDANNNDNPILGYRLFTQDEQLLKYLSEVALEKSEFSGYLKKELFKSRKKHIGNTEKDNQIVNAAANAISIMVYGDIYFTRMDLSEIRINGANIT